MKPALEFVILRGVSRSSMESRVLFQDDRDKDEFLRRLSKALLNTNTRLHAFCLTGGDVRLLLEPIESTVAACVQHVSSHFARWTNTRRGRSGHVFEKRYRSVQLQERLVLPVVWHIHRTPAVARLIDSGEEYRWSSHSTYLGSHVIAWVDTHRVLGLLEKETAQARQSYRRYMAAQRLPRRPGENGQPPMSFCDGDGPFLDWLRKQTRRERMPGTLEQIIEATCRRLKVSAAELVSSSRKRRLSLARAVIAWHVVNSGIDTWTGVAVKLRRDTSTLYSGVNRYRAINPDLFDISLEVFLKATVENRTELRDR